VRKCVLYYCHWVSTQWQLTDISTFQWLVTEECVPWQEHFYSADKSSFIGYVDSTKDLLNIWAIQSKQHPSSNFILSWMSAHTKTLEQRSCLGQMWPTWGRICAGLAPRTGFRLILIYLSRLNLSIYLTTDVTLCLDFLVPVGLKSLVELLVKVIPVSTVSSSLRLVLGASPA